MLLYCGVPESITSIPKRSITGRRNDGRGLEVSAWEMKGGDSPGGSLVIRAAETCGRDVREANKQGGGGSVGGGCWEAIKKLNGHKFLNEFGVSGEKTISFPAGPQ